MLRRRMHPDQARVSLGRGVSYRPGTSLKIRPPGAPNERRTRARVLEYLVRKEGQRRAASILRVDRKTVARDMERGTPGRAGSACCGAPAAGT